MLILSVPLSLNQLQFLFGMKFIRIHHFLLWWILEVVVADFSYGKPIRMLNQEITWGWKYVRNWSSAPTFG
jgi:hypothetical protein